jgi:hypothetical protein
MIAAPWIRNRPKPVVLQWECNAKCPHADTRGSHWTRSWQVVLSFCMLTADWTRAIVSSRLTLPPVNEKYCWLETIYCVYVSYAFIREKETVLPVAVCPRTAFTNYKRNVNQNTRWFKYDRDKLWLVYTQIVPVIFEPPCIFVMKLRMEGPRRVWYSCVSAVDLHLSVT